MYMSRNFTYPPSCLQFLVMSFKMKKLLIYEKEDEMETGGPLSVYEFRYCEGLARGLGVCVNTVIRENFVGEVFLP